ncbi:MAG: hypothetical protein LC725_11750 [Lentisphaerae bacterium]|nr:hypothetical protein [Lentisphaerota bacterium]
MNAIELIWECAKQEPQHIVLPEGADPRTVVAAYKIVQQGLGRVTVLGNRDQITGLCKDNAIEMERFEVIDPVNSPLLDGFIRTYRELRQGKQTLTADEARQVMTDEVAFGAMMVRNGHADGLVAGATHATADIRPQRPGAA